MWNPIHSPFRFLCSTHYLYLCLCVYVLCVIYVCFERVEQNRTNTIDNTPLTPHHRDDSNGRAHRGTLSSLPDINVEQIDRHGWWLLVVLWLCVGLGSLTIWSDRINEILLRFIEHLKQKSCISLPL